MLIRGEFNEEKIAEQRKKEHGDGLTCQGGGKAEAADGAGNNGKSADVKTTAPGELEITQELRQQGYDNWETTDDHGMIIYGIAKDQNGKEWFMMKNSWGEYGPYKGFWYVSYPFVAYKTMNIVLHKDALPKDIKKKLGIK